MNQSPPLTWLLLDDQPRYRSQVGAVAERLGWPAIAKEMRYNRLASLTQTFSSILGMRHLATDSHAAIRPPWPELLIGAGEHQASVMLAIKKRSLQTRLVHIMWPQASPHSFDIIALSESSLHKKAGANILSILGVPHGLTPAKLIRETNHWQNTIARLPRPRIAVLIGGSTAGTQYEEADFKSLGAYAAAEAERLGGSLMLSSGPRTGEKGESWVKSPLTAPHVFHRWNPEKQNPYLAYLTLADAIIVTGDSMSMCSQACALGKPVYIFVPPHSRIGKKGFCDTLFTRGFAKPHTYPIRLDWSPPPFPDTTGEIAQAIRSKFFTAT